MRFRFILSETFKGLTRNLAMTVSVILVAFVSLLFVGASALLQQQISTMKGSWYDKVEVSVYMCPASSGAASSGTSCPGGEATQEQIDAVEAFINSNTLRPYVKSYTFESKAEAYAKFKEVYGDRDIGRSATEEMMPVSFRIKLIDAEKYQVVAEQLTGRDGVQRVVDQRKTLETFFLVMNRASWITGGLAAIMAVAAVLLISTTIRLSAMSRSKETEIMRLVGASNLFIQLPFMLEGAIAALIGALAAVGSLWVGVHYIVDGWLAQSLTFINTAFISSRHVLVLAPWLLLAAVVLAAVSSSFSLSKYTRV
ncbi:permease-like cell division protein FtsX [Actinomyces israelii]|uniref:permease-like cell division protein FtsX n=1 Tax=Actinomyces israelii TaxID=1659 RepID=UPI0005BD5AF0|nr:permease-like cell division protein FtsX [Actinomyces israelii]